MKTFTVKALDGRTLKVQGNDREGAAKAAEEYVRANPLRGRQAADADARRRVASAPGQVRAVNKGATFGFADEIDAAGAALETGVGNVFKRASGQEPSYGMRDAFGAVMDANAEADARFAREKPVQNLGLQIGGGMAGVGVAAGARFVGRARGLVDATLRSGGLGAVTGAVAGAGNSRGDIVERGKGAAKGAAVGAVVGAAVPSVARAAQTVGRAANAAVGQPFGGANRGAVARLREALQQDGLTSEQINQTVQQWRQSGVTPEFLNVAGENTRALVRAAGSQSGPARNAAQSYRDTTVASIPNRAIERANALTPGETRTPAQFIQNTRVQRRTAANASYAAPDAAPVDITGEMAEAMRGNTGRAAIAEARRVAEINGDLNVLNELDQLPDGDLSSFPQMTGRTLEAVRRAFRDMGRREAAGTGPTGASRGYSNRVDQMDTGLDALFAQPRAQYAAQTRAMEVAEDAPNVLGPRSEFAPAMDELAPNALAVDGARIANRQGLRDYFGTRDQVRGRLADIDAAPDVRGNLNQLYGERGDQFADAAGNLVRKQDQANFIAPNTGSQTQLRGQDAEGAFGFFSNAMEVLGGSLRPLVQRMARGLTMTEAERNVLVQLGIGSPEEALRALAAPAPVGRLGGAVSGRLGVAVPAVTSSGTAGR